MKTLISFFQGNLDRFFHTINHGLCRIAVYLAHHDAHDRSQFLEAVSAAYRDRDGERPRTEAWDRIANISDVTMYVYVRCVCCMLT